MFFFYLSTNKLSLSSCCMSSFLLTHLFLQSACMYTYNVSTTQSLCSLSLSTFRPRNLSILVPSISLATIKLYLPVFYSIPTLTFLCIDFKNKKLWLRQHLNFTPCNWDRQQQTATSDSIKYNRQDHLASIKRTTKQESSWTVHSIKQKVDPEISFTLSS